LNIKETVSAWPYERRDLSSVADWIIGQDNLVDVVVIVEVVRRALIEPARLASIDIAGEYSSRELVVPGPLLLIPRPWIGRAIVNRFGCGVVADPTPHSAAADLPIAWWPALYPKLATLILRIRRAILRADQDVFVRPGAVSLPGNLPRARIQRRQPTTDTHLST
jgi:hypothetical protein